MIEDKGNKEEDACLLGDKFISESRRLVFGDPQ
jgi:hypothetical protein